MESTEQWLPVVGWPEYEVSDQGRMRSLPRTITASAGWAMIRRGRVLKPTVIETGHLVVNLQARGKKSRQRVHRLVLAAFVGPCPEGMEGCHNNGNPADNRRSNLRWDTRLSNNMDTIAHGRHQPTNATHCAHGHALADPNLEPGRKKMGGRNCLACRRARPVALKNGVDFNELADDYYRKIMRHGSLKASRIACRNGHQLAGDNLIAHQLKFGRRSCRACANARDFQKRRGLPFDPALADRYFTEYTTVE